MKNICLVTSEESFLNNYGAALQGYALYSTLLNLGYDVRILKYKGGMQHKNSSSKIHTYMRTIVKTLSFNSISEIITKINFRINQRKYHFEYTIQRKLFQQFKNRMKFYNMPQMNWDELKDNYPKADIYVCGSDQIWNPMFKGGKNDLGYFLYFVPHGQKKIAYSPSFGISELPFSAQGNIKELVSDFSSISVREEAGVAILKKYAGVEAVVNADPTLLLSNSEWEKIAILPKDLPKQYILCYRFCDSDFIENKIREIQNITGLPVITLPLSGAAFKDQQYIKYFHAGPAEFVGMIKNASLVCTDSFHATVFSILMNTPFITFKRGDTELKGMDMDSRIIQLLGLTRLEARLLSKDTVITIEYLYGINFNEAMQNIRDLSDRSMVWLKNALRD